MAANPFSFTKIVMLLLTLMGIMSSKKESLAVILICSSNQSSECKQVITELIRQDTEKKLFLIANRNLYQTPNVQFISGKKCLRFSQEFTFFLPRNDSVRSCVVVWDTISRTVSGDIQVFDLSAQQTFMNRSQLNINDLTSYLIDVADLQAIRRHIMSTGVNLKRNRFKLPVSFNQYLCEFKKFLYLNARFCDSILKTTSHIVKINNSLIDHDSIFYGEKVYILTRTSGRPFLYNQLVKSISTQVYKNIEHLVVTDDVKSKTYVNGSNLLVLKNTTSFTPDDVVSICGKRKRFKKRLKFLKCYCKTSYPMNEYFNQLHQRIVDPGWIIYLDDDNLFTKRSSLSMIMSWPRKRDDLIVWRSQLGRVTPSKNFRIKFEMGDVDSSTFMFHSTHLSKTAWDKRRCGDYWTLKSLENHLYVRWLDVILTASHPFRTALSGIGGLGKRTDIPMKTTIVITSFSNDSFRTRWLQFMVAQYTSAFYNDLIDQVIIVWNNPNELPLIPLPSKKVTLLVQKTNSLNNRWKHIQKYVRTETILNLDDDAFVRYDGIRCLMSYWIRESKPIGVFARDFSQDKYQLHEIEDRDPYIFVLPRVLLISKKDIALYKYAPSEILDYINTQEAHCDDILLNLLIMKKRGAGFLRAVLPKRTLVDFYRECFEKFPVKTGGLALQNNRLKLRTRCVRDLSRMVEVNPQDFRKDTAGFCGDGGVRAKGYQINARKNFRKMFLKFEC